MQITGAAVAPTVSWSTLQYLVWCKALTLCHGSFRAETNIATIMASLRIHRTEGEEFTVGRLVRPALSESDWWPPMCRDWFAEQRFRPSAPARPTDPILNTKHPNLHRIFRKEKSKRDNTITNAGTDPGNQADWTAGLRKKALSDQLPAWSTPQLFSVYAQWSGKLLIDDRFFPFKLINLITFDMDPPQGPWFHFFAFRSFIEMFFVCFNPDRPSNTKRSWN